MNLNLKEASVGELKIRFYDEAEKLGIIQKNIQALNQEIALRRTQTAQEQPINKD